MSGEKLSDFLSQFPKKRPEVGAVVGVNTHEASDELGGLSGELLRIEEKDGKQVGIVEIPGKGEFEVDYEKLMGLNR